MAGGMSRGAGIPLKDRRLGGEPAGDGGVFAGAPTPCATPCWVKLTTGPVAGTVLGWQQGAGGTWWALVSAWLPQQAVERRAGHSEPTGSAPGNSVPGASVPEQPG